MIARRIPQLVRPMDSSAAELGVLAAFLFDQQQLDVFEHVIAAEDFRDEVNAEAFRTIQGMHQQGMRISDMPSLKSRLSARPKIGQAAAALIAKIIHGGTAENARFYVDELLRCSKHRRLTEILSEAVDSLKRAPVDVEVTVASLDSQVRALQESAKLTGSVAIGAAAKESLTVIAHAKQTHELMGVPTGIFDLDGVIGGLHAGELNLVAGLPGGGKTALALQIAANAAARERPVWFCSLEMTRNEVARRLICSLAKVSLQAIRTGTVTANEMQRLNAASEEVDTWPLNIWDPSAATLRELRAEARHQKAVHGTQLIIIDYLSLIEKDPVEHKGMDRKDYVGDNIRRLKQLAKELQLPVVCLAQPNREGAKAGRFKPHHIAETASCERDADCILFLEWDPSVDQRKDRFTVTFNIAKNRHGPVTEFELDFDKERMLFIDSLEAAR